MWEERVGCGLSYQGPSSIPDWQGTISTLEEVLEDVLDTIDEDRRQGVRPDVIGLTALDTLNQYLERIKQDMGV